MAEGSNVQVSKKAKTHRIDFDLTQHITQIMRSDLLKDWDRVYRKQESSWKQLQHLCDKLKDDLPPKRLRSLYKDMDEIYQLWKTYEIRLTGIQLELNDNEELQKKMLRIHMLNKERKKQIRRSKDLIQSNLKKETAPDEKAESEASQQSYVAHSHASSKASSSHPKDTSETNARSEVSHRSRAPSQGSHAAPSHVSKRTSASSPKVTQGEKAASVRSHRSHTTSQQSHAASSHASREASSFQSKAGSSISQQPSRYSHRSRISTAGEALLEAGMAEVDLETAREEQLLKEELAAAVAKAQADKAAAVAKAQADKAAAEAKVRTQLEYLRCKQEANKRLVRAKVLQMKANCSSLDCSPRKLEKDNQHKHVKAYMDDPSPPQQEQGGKSRSGSQDTILDSLINVQIEETHESAQLPLPPSLEWDNPPDDRSQIVTPEVASIPPHLKHMSSHSSALDPKAEILPLPGTDTSNTFTAHEVDKGPKDSPSALETAFGRGIFGMVCVDRLQVPTQTNIFTTSSIEPVLGATVLQTNKEFLRFMVKEFLQEATKIWMAPIPLCISRQLDEEYWHSPSFRKCQPKEPEQIRAPFDTSMQSQGLSLNKALFKSPNLTNSRLSMLIQPRKEADNIQQMFNLCFMWSSNDQHNQQKQERPVWQESLSCLQGVPIQRKYVPTLAIATTKAVTTVVCIKIYGGESNVHIVYGGENNVHIIYGGESNVHISLIMGRVKLAPQLPANQSQELTRFKQLSRRKPLMLGLAVIIFTTLVVEGGTITNSQALIPEFLDPEIPTALTPATLLSQKTGDWPEPAGNFIPKYMYWNLWPKGLVPMGTYGLWDLCNEPTLSTGTHGYGTCATSPTL